MNNKNNFMIFSFVFYRYISKYSRLHVNNILGVNTQYLKIHFSENSTANKY